MRPRARSRARATPTAPATARTTARPRSTPSPSSRATTRTDTRPAPRTTTPARTTPSSSRRTSRTTSASTRRSPTRRPSRSTSSRRRRSSPSRSSRTGTPAPTRRTAPATDTATTAGGDTGIYEQFPPQQQYEQQPQHQYAYDYQAPAPEPEAPAEPEAYEYTYAYEPAAEATAATATATAVEAEDGLADEPGAAERHDYAADSYEAGVPVARSRRRKPAKRSALLTVAVPSVAVMGVAAVGAAAVTGVGMAQDSGSAKADATTTGKAPTTQLDRQLAGVSQNASDFADRASRTQERIDLKDRQAAAKRAADAAAARKEALRPKFLLPVKQKGLSAYFGQAGVNWMALHTGIDFPVMVGTPVMAVTDGTVRTQWSNSYGNMAIVTAPDGTETWYCHLSSTKIRSGSVKAGTVIAYSGNTGNTTGPHLHLEVRPGGGSPIDPLPWLLKHGLDPR